MSERISIEVDVKYAQAIDAFVKLADRTGGLDSGLQKVASTAKRVQSEFKSVENSLLTPLEKYSRDLDKLYAARSSGNISAERLQALVQRRYSNYRENLPENVAAKKAAEEAAVAIKKAADAQDLFNQKTRQAYQTSKEMYSARVQELVKARKSGLDNETYQRALGDAATKYKQSLPSFQADAISERERERIRLANQTPYERLRVGFNQLRELYPKGGEDYKRERSRMFEQFKASDEGMKAQKKAADDVAASIAKANAELKRYADRTKELNATPLEKYAASVAKAKEALKAGQLSQEDFNREVARAGQQLEEAGKSGEKTFGAAAISSITSYAAGIFTIATAVGAVKGAFEDLAAARERGLQGGMESIDAMLEATAAGATAEEKRIMSDKFQKLRTMPGAGGYSMAQTASGYSRAYQAGFDDKAMRQLFLAAPQTRGEIESLAQLAETARVNFGKEKLTHLEAMNAALSVAKVTQADPQDIAKFYGQSLPLLSQGFKYSEAIGLQAAFQTAFGKGQIGADRSRALMMKLNENEETRDMLSRGDASGIFNLIESFGTEEWIDRFGKDGEAMASMYAIKKDEVRAVYKTATDKAQSVKDSIRKGQSDESFIVQEAKAIQGSGIAADMMSVRESGQKAQLTEIEAYATGQGRKQKMTDYMNRVVATTGNWGRLAMRKAARSLALGTDYATGTDYFSTEVESELNREISQYISQAESDGFVSEEEAKKIQELRSTARQMYGTRYSGETAKTELDMLSNPAAPGRQGIDVETSGGSQLLQLKIDTLTEIMRRNADASVEMKDEVKNGNGLIRRDFERAGSMSGRD